MWLRRVRRVGGGIGCLRSSMRGLRLTVRTKCWARASAAIADTLLALPSRYLLVANLSFRSITHRRFYRSVRRSPPTAIPGPPLRTSLASHGLETDYHPLLHSAHPHPSTGAPDTGTDSLKLGPAPRNPALEREVKRKLRDEGDDEADSKEGKKADEMAVDSGAAGAEGAEGEGSKAVATTDADEDAGKKATSTTEDLVSPFPAELPPYPAVFRTLDVQREVSLVREARKRIKLGGEAYAPEGALVPTNTGGAGAALGAALIGGEDGKKGEREDKRRGVAKPSVCLFTVHDAGERCARDDFRFSVSTVSELTFHSFTVAHSLTTVSFSEDSTMMATGFSESYIRLWSLNGKGLRALRTDLKSEEVGKIHDGAWTVEELVSAC